jgi:GLPGLI family protein
MKFILLILFSTICFSQQNNIAHYKIDYLYDLDNNNESISRFNSFFSDAKKHAEDVELRLIFNKERSVFIMLEDNKNSENKMAFNLCGCEKPVYMNTLNKSIKYFNKGSMPMQIPDEKYILTNDLFSHWQLHDEQKVINGYLTFKATKQLKTVDGKIRNIIAWYAPEFPYAYGPSIYGGLPGLIVQLQTKDKMFVLYKIEFNKDVLLPAEPTKGDIINADEYDKMEYEKYLNM